jgi:hypothetical protein
LCVCVMMTSGGRFPVHMLHPLVAIRHTTGSVACGGGRGDHGENLKVGEFRDCPERDAG